MSPEATALRVLRVATGLRQSELAAAAGVSRQHLCNVESGAKVLSPRLGAAIASILAPMLRADVADVRALLGKGKEDG